ncbi:putative membrane protein [Anoxybacillus tepidamans]|uniref:Putative membrane protein n=1 Tax=Anoxybacteroides tepidamans TaxID=265948 RepID=A0A7W8IRQ4_9BACL|nr:hypothetical protein [Anoxybacillus tepidamans]MBB5324706.1 putative membrane protein [Anoxybacillus tepidamans]
MRKAIYRVLVFMIALFIYRYRYRMLNNVLRIRLLQQLLVRIGMSIPFVRQAIVSQVFR